MRQKIRILAVTGLLLATSHAALALPSQSPENDVQQLLKTLEETYTIDYCPGRRECRDPRRDKVIAALDQLKGRNKAEACGIVKQIARQVGTRWNHIGILSKALEALEGYNASISQECRDNITAAYVKFLKKQDRQEIDKRNSSPHGGHFISVWDTASDEEVARFEKRFKHLVCSEPLKPGLSNWEYVVALHTGRETNTEQVVCQAGE